MKRIMILTACLWAGVASAQPKVLRESGVRTSVDTSLTTKKSDIWGWGDSQFEISPGVLTRMHTLSGRYVYNRGVAGETALFIKNRMIANLESHNAATIIWAGRNGVLNTAISSVMPYIKQMVDSVKNGNYVIINLIHGGGEGTGTAAHDSISRFNDSLAARWGARVFDANATVKTWYTSSPADQANLAQDVAPRSSRSDSIHLTSAAYQRLADSLFKYKYQYLAFADDAIPSNRGAINMLNGTSDITAVSASVSNGQSTTANIDGRLLTTDFLLNQTSATLGAQLVTNPTFNGNLSGWTATNWQYANGGAQHITGNTTALSQSISVEANATYEVKVWISQKTAGNISQVSFLGATRTGIPNDGLGTYAFSSPTATNSTLSIIPSSTYDGTVDSVSVRRIDRDVFLPSIKPQFFLRDSLGNVVTSITGNRFGVVGMGGVSINYGYPFSRVLDQSTFSLGMGSGVFPNAAMFTNTAGAGSNIANYVPMALGSTFFGTNLFNASGLSYLENQTAFGYNIFTGNSGYNNIGFGTSLHTGTTTFNRSIMIGNNLSFRSTSEAGQINIANLINGKGAVGTGTTQAGNVGIGTNDPNTSAILDLTSTTAGVLIPRMTTAQANAIPTRATGLMVINTDSSRLWYWNGAAWRGFRTTDESALSSAGRYTPTAIASTNVSSITTSYSAHYTQVGNEVTVTGVAVVECTAGSATSAITLTLPNGWQYANTYGDAEGVATIANLSTRSSGFVTFGSTSAVTVQFTSVAAGQNDIHYKFTFTKTN